MEKTTGTILVGMKAICKFTGRSENTVKRWIRMQNFPAVFVDGRWESNSALIDTFMLRRIKTLIESSGREAA
jgi:predicted DNA-binding transcriptional regulator AlpA